MNADSNGIGVRRPGAAVPHAVSVNMNALRPRYSIVLVPSALTMFSRFSIRSPG